MQRKLIHFAFTSALVCGAIASTEACAGQRTPARTVLVAEPRVEVPLDTRHQLTFDLPNLRVERDDVVIDARFIAPSGNEVRVGGFASHGRFAVRFTPRELGPHLYVVRANDGNGEREVLRGTIVGTPSEAHGFVHLDPGYRRRLVDDRGATVYVLGENRINIYDPKWNYENADIRTYIERMASFGMSTIRVFVFADCEAEDVDGGYQIGCLERGIGRFDEKTADAFDTIFDAAEHAGIDVIVVAFSIGFTPPPDTWKSWADNPYSSERGGPARAPEEFFTDPALRPRAARKLRYIADRWASSARFLAVDLLNEPEWDGPIPERSWVPWAQAMAEAWRSFDPYHHLVTAGPVGLQSNIGSGDERPWYASSANDIVQWHLYGKEFYDPYALAREMTRKVEETWNFGKPIICGEFAYGGEDRSTYDHTHMGIWSLLFSGAGALAHSAPTFQIDSDLPMTPERGAHFRVLSHLLHSLSAQKRFEPWHDVQVSPAGARAWTLVAHDATERAVWIVGPEAGYGSRVQGARATFPAPPAGRHHLTWIDDVTGSTLVDTTFASSGTGNVTVDVPPFVRHVAARIVAE